MSEFIHQKDSMIQGLADEAGKSYEQFVNDVCVHLRRPNRHERVIGIEPEGVDFSVNSTPMSTTEKEELSNIIKQSKNMKTAMGIVDTKRKDKRDDDKPSAGIVLPKP